MKRKKSPSGRMIDAGKIAFSPGANTVVDTDKLGSRQLSQYTVEDFEPYVSSLPAPMGTIILRLARAGMRVRQGKGRGFMSAAAKAARDTAMKEKPAVLRYYRARGKAEGRPRTWAREEAAKAVQQRMRDLGDEHPPSTEAILKRGILRTRSRT